MEPMTFEEFTEKIGGPEQTSDIELRGMARDLDLDVPPNIRRDTLLKRLFEASDIPKKSTPVEATPKPVSSPTNAPPGVVYQVSLKAKANRWRGGCLWRPGMTQIPEKDMSRAVLKALEGDKDFRIQKVKIEE